MRQQLIFMLAVFKYLHKGSKYQCWTVGVQYS